MTKNTRKWLEALAGAVLVLGFGATVVAVGVIAVYFMGGYALVLLSFILLVVIFRFT